MSRLNPKNKKEIKFDAAKIKKSGEIIIKKERAGGRNPNPEKSIASKKNNFNGLLLSAIAFLSIFSISVFSQSDEPLGCCTVNQGTAHLDNLRQSECNSLSGTWVYGDCPNADKGCCFLMSGLRVPDKTSEQCRSDPEYDAWQRGPCPAKTCADSDGGGNLGEQALKPGSAKGASGETGSPVDSKDECVDSKVLKEYYCDLISDYVGSTKIACTNSCNAGVGSGAFCNSECSDPDGEDKYFEGIVTVGGAGGDKERTKDACRDGKVTEQLCKNGKREEKQIVCENGCAEDGSGACKNGIKEEPKKSGEALIALKNSFDGSSVDTKSEAADTVTTFSNDFGSVQITQKATDIGSGDISSVNIEYNKITYTANQPAQLVFTGVKTETIPFVEKSGQTCAGCRIVSYTPETGLAVVDIPGPGTYSTKEGTEPLPQQPTLKQQAEPSNNIPLIGGGAVLLAASAILAKKSFSLKSRKTKNKKQGKSRKKAGRRKK